MYRDLARTGQVISQPGWKASARQKSSAARVSRSLRPGERHLVDLAGRLMRRIVVGVEIALRPLVEHGELEIAERSYSAAASSPAGTLMASP